MFEEQYNYIAKLKESLLERIINDYDSVIDKNKFIVKQGKNLGSLDSLAYVPKLKEIRRRVYNGELDLILYYCTDEELCRWIYRLSCDVQNTGVSEIDFYSYEDMVEREPYFRYMLVDKDLLTND